MFRRRTPISFSHKILGFFWPAMGWRRAAKYTLHRLTRLPGTPYSIACGFACGAAVSFTPFVGLHFVIAAGVAWVIRANVLASIIGTAVGNPWTFPFIWTWLYKTGAWIITGGHPEQAAPPNFGNIFSHIMKAFLDFDMQYLLETAAPVFWPMLVSSVPTMFVVWWVVYLPLKYIVRGHHKRRARKQGRDRKDF